MKKLTKSLAAMLMVGLFFVITSCSEDEPVPDGPQISITAPGLTVSGGSLDLGVTQDTTLIVSYTVDAPGVIQTLEHSVDGVSEAVSAAIGQNTYTRQVVLEVPYENTEIVVQVSTTDEHSQTASQSLTVAVEAIVPPAIPLTENQLITMGGSSSPTHFSRWDLDRPKGFGYWGLQGNDSDQIPTIDSYYTTLSLGDTDLGQGQFEESGAKFLITEFSRQDYLDMEDDAQLQDLEIEETYLQFIEVGQVIAFRTNLDKLGVMYIKEYYEGTDDLDIEIKLQDK